MDSINIKSKLKPKEIKLDVENDTIKLLLSENEAKKIEVVKSLGLDDDIKKYNELEAKKIYKQNYEKEFGANIFHIDEIKELCLNYDLRFLSSNHYKGDFKAFLIDKVVEFSDKHKINVNGTFVNNDFMILDVRENFKNNYSHKKIFKNIINKKYRNEPFLF